MCACEESLSGTKKFRAVPGTTSFRDANIRHNSLESNDQYSCILLVTVMYQMGSTFYTVHFVQVCIAVCVDTRGKVHVGGLFRSTLSAPAPYGNGPSEACCYYFRDPCLCLQHCTF